MKRSIRIRFTVIWVAVLAAVILSLFLFMNFGLEPYAAGRKQSEIKKAVALIEEYVDASWDGDHEKELTRYVITNGLGACIYCVSGLTPYERYSSNYNLDTMNAHLINFMSSGRIAADEILADTPDYAIYRIYDSNMQSDQIECIGVHGDAVYILSASMAGIRETAEATGRFLLAISAGALVIGGIAIYFVSRRITRPIVSLAEQSEAISRMDFSGRYTGRERDEIGTLGEGINLMSERLKENIDELTRANEKLEQDIREKERIDEARRDLIANISHELKTPIALIQGYAEGLKDGITEGDRENAQFYLDVILDESGRMNQLVKKLLNLDEIESGSFRAEPEWFDLTEVIGGVLRSFSLKSEAKDVRVVLRAPEQLRVFADAFLIEEVLQNYVSNAINHVSDPGCIEVSAAHLEGGQAELRVFNSGAQIPEEALPRLWEKFYKVDKAHTRSYGGSGIGLSIVRAIADAQGAACGAENTGDGVSFWFRFTAVPREGSLSRENG